MKAAADEDGREEMTDADGDVVMGKRVLTKKGAVLRVLQVSVVAGL